jgi:hypothetical protein
MLLINIFTKHQCIQTQLYSLDQMPYIQLSMSYLHSYIF